MGGFAGSLNLNQALGAGGLSALLGGLAGIFPSTGSGTSNQAYSNQSQQAGASTFDMNSLMNYLNNLTSSQTGTTTGTSTTGVMPTLSPETYALMTQLIGKAQGLTTPSLTGYTAGQTQNINANADAQRAAINNIMASRGLSTSPAAATAQAGIEQNRLNQINQLQQQVPLLQNQMNLQNLAGASSLFAALPKGTQTTGTTGQTSQQTGTQTGTGSQTGQQTGTTTSAQTGTSSGTQTGTTQQQQGGGIGGALGGIASGVASVLPWLLFGLSDKRFKDDIKDIPQDKAIEKLRELKGKSWKWKDSDIDGSGVVAQDLERSLPHLVHSLKVRPGDKDEDSVKLVNYHGLVPYIIGAIQNLDKRMGVVKT